MNARANTSILPTQAASSGLMPTLVTQIGPAALAPMGR